MYVLISDGDQDHADNSRDEGDVAKAVSLSPFTYFFLLYTTFYRSSNAIFENSCNDDDDNNDKNFTSISEFAASFSLFCS